MVRENRTINVSLESGTSPINVFVAEQIRVFAEVYRNFSEKSAYELRRLGHGGLLNLLVRFGFTSFDVIL